MKAHARTHLLAMEGFVQELAHITARRSHVILRWHLKRAAQEAQLDAHFDLTPLTLSLGVPEVAEIAPAARAKIAAAAVALAAIFPTPAFPVGAALGELLIGCTNLDEAVGVTALRQHARGAA